jgi:hypothetical protein
MNLEQAIHERWAASAALAALVGADRLKTGLARGTGTPYATLVRKPGRTLARTNAGDALDQIPLVIRVWHDQFDAGQAIAQQVKAAFDRSQFALGGGDRVLQMRRGGESVVQHDDGIWEWAIEFSVQVYLVSGH